MESSFDDTLNNLSDVTVCDSVSNSEALNPEELRMLQKERRKALRQYADHKALQDQATEQYSKGMELDRYMFGWNASQVFRGYSCYPLNKANSTGVIITKNVVSSSSCGTLKSWPNNPRIALKVSNPGLEPESSLAKRGVGKIEESLNPDKSNVVEVFMINLTLI